MTFGSAELYELFLTLAPPRLARAREALTSAAPNEVHAELEAALSPFCVDAALLGAEGLAELARALVHAARATPGARLAALDRLEAATAELGSGDSSGARVNEAELRALAHELLATPARPDRADAPPAETATSTEAEPWIPDLAEDMVAAFLDECGERIDGLSERLLALERDGANPELVAEIFRDLHTLKGSSAFAGLTPMNQVAHRAEDLVAELRDGRRSASPALISVLLAALDVLRAMLETAREGRVPKLDVTHLLARLKDPELAARDAAPAAEQLASGPATATHASEATPAAAAPAPSTLRIEFEKVDLLLNLVGEIVLARGRLNAVAEMQNALLREFVQLRKKLVASAGTHGQRPQASLLGDELQRTERVLRETFTEFDASLGTLQLGIGQLRDTVMKLRMVPIVRLFTKHQRTVRELAQKLGKQVRVELAGSETELDKVLVERLDDPLLHLVRNAVDHGIEDPATRRADGKPELGTILLSASRRGGQIVVTIGDDGRGLDPEKLKARALTQGLITPADAESLSDEAAYDLIFMAGFSTARAVSDISGRGVGMDVVRDAVLKLKGTIGVSSELGRGSRFELRLPLTLAITQVLAARVAGELVAVPLDAVESAQSARRSELETVASGPCLRSGRDLIPLIDLAAVLGFEANESSDELSVVIVRVGSERIGLVAEQVLGRHEVVLKPLGPLLARVPCALGATLIQDRVLLVVDLAEAYARSRQPANARPERAPARARSESRARVLVAEDSELIRESLCRALTAAGFEVTPAADGAEALALARQGDFDAVSTDVVMPRLDGYELVRALRNEPKYSRTPIVMVSAKDARLDALRGRDAGADAYLTKPADAAELIETLEALIRTRALRRR